MYIYYGKFRKPDSAHPAGVIPRIKTNYFLHHMISLNLLLPIIMQYWWEKMNYFIIIIAYLFVQDLLECLLKLRNPSVWKCAL